MAFLQVGIPFYEELHQTAFIDPITLPESPPASSPGHSFSSDDTATTASSGYHSSSSTDGVPVIRASSSRLSNPKSSRRSSMRRLSNQFQTMMISGYVDLKRLSELSRSHGTDNSSQQTQDKEDENGKAVQRRRRRSSLERDETGKIRTVSSVVSLNDGEDETEKDDNTQIRHKGRRRSNLEREDARKVEAVSRVVSPDAGFRATAAFPDAVLIGTDSVCFDSILDLKDTDKGAWNWKCETSARKEEESRLVRKFRLKRQRLYDSYQKRMERMAADFSEIRKDLRALHLEERCDLNRKWEEDSLETLHDFLDSEQFEFLSDEDYDRTLRQLADQNERKRQSDLEQLERRHMADWRRFLSDKKFCLVQIQEALETKLKLLDTDETQMTSHLQTGRHNGF